METADARVKEDNVAIWVSTNEEDLIIVVVVIVVVVKDDDVLEDRIVLENS